ncbi:MAG: APC family permease [Hyphomicrobium sp.]
MAPKAQLKRQLTIWLVIFYGLGTTIGAGIYALVGKIAGVAGYHAPWSFLVAAGLVAFTVTSYAEMSRRYPRAAGAALYVREGLGSVRLSTLVGLLVALAGLTSASALANAFVGYLQELIAIDATTAIVLTILVLGGIAAIGITESVAVASVITAIEIFGLLLVVGVNYQSFGAFPAHIDALAPPMDFPGWGLVLSGAMLAFFAFLGFEDMVVIAEEVRDVKRNLPLAIFATLAITTVLYLLVVTVAVLAMPPEELAASQAPLAALYQKGAGSPPTLINAIAGLAIINGVLIQLIMASRLLYGLASTLQIPTVFAYVDPRTHTPLVATVTVTAVTLPLSLLGTLTALAEATSAIMLMVFALVNLSAWRVKCRMPAEEGLPSIPTWVPLAGFVISVVFVVSQLWP